MKWMVENKNVHQWQGQAWPVLISPWHSALGPLQHPQGEPRLPGNLALPSHTARNASSWACQERLFFCELAGHSLHSAAQGPLRVPIPGTLLSPKALIVPLRETTCSEVGRLMGLLGLLGTPVWLWFLEPCIRLGVP